MKLGLISDIHGNLDALKAVYEAIAPRVEQVVCLGDVVDGGDQDDECVEFLESHLILTVGGNHDDSCLRANDPPLKPANRQWLESLPETLDVSGVHLVHDNPLARAREGQGMWGRGSYIRTEYEASVVFEECEQLQLPGGLVAVGHTHKPAIYSVSGEIEYRIEEAVPLGPEAAFILNPGAVGYSRGGAPQANYAVLDTTQRTFTICAVEARSIFS